MDKTQHNNNETRAEGSPDLSVLGDQLLGLTKGLTDFFAGLDPAQMDPEALTAQVIVFLDGFKALIQVGDEEAYVSRAVGMFLAERMSAALRRGRRGEDVPHEQAAIIDALYQKVQSVKSGIAGDAPDVRQLEDMADTAQKQMRNFMTQAGLVRKIPKEASDHKIVLSG